MFRKTAREGVQLGDKRFDEAHEVRCRDESQAQAFFAPLAEALFALHKVQMDDDTLVAELRNNGTVSTELTTFAVPLVALAKRLGDARRKIPPPAAASGSLPVWKELAAKLDGTLDPSSMIINGRFRGLGVEIETTWTPDGKPAEIATAVKPAGPIEEAMTGDLAIHLMMEDLPQAIPATARPLLESLSGLVETVRIRRDQVATATPWLARPEHALSLVRTLVEIAEVLSPGAGPTDEITRNPRPAIRRVLEQEGRAKTHGRAGANARQDRRPHASAREDSRAGARAHPRTGAGSLSRLRQARRPPGGKEVLSLRARRVHQG